MIKKIAKIKYFKIRQLILTFFKISFRYKACAKSIYNIIFGMKLDEYVHFSSKIGQKNNKNVIFH